MGIKTDIKTFSCKVWNNEGNKSLLNIVNKDRLNMAPCTVYKLDQLGFNSLEIVNLSECLNKYIYSLPTADIDNLNYWQEQYGVVFGYTKKAEGKPLQAKVDHLCYAFMNDEPMGVLGLFSLDIYE